jgi:hypothetical protein
MKNKDSLTVKFSDDENTYNLYIKIDIKQFYLRTDKMTLLLMMLKKCYIKFKIWPWYFEVIGQLAKNVDLKK